jgi:hypothetical protein
MEKAEIQPEACHVAGVTKAEAKNIRPCIRRAFFVRYTTAVGTNIGESRKSDWLRDQLFEDCLMNTTRSSRN